MNTEKICTLSVDHAIKISKVIATAPVERMPMITQLFHQAAVDLEGLDELIATSSISKQGALIDTIAFLEELTAGRELSEQGNLFTTEEFNQFCYCEKSSAPSCKASPLCRRLFGSEQRKQRQNGLFDQCLCGRQDAAAGCN